MTGNDEVFGVTSGSEKREQELWNEEVQVSVQRKEAANKT